MAVCCRRCRRGVAWSGQRTVLAHVNGRVGSRSSASSPCSGHPCMWCPVPQPTFVMDTGPGRILRLFRPGVGKTERNHEAYLSAECSSPGQAPRLPSAHVHEGRPVHREQPPPPRKEKAVRLIWRVTDRDAFAALHRRGITARGKHGWVRWIENPRNRCEVAFAIGRKFGSAARRNRRRRQIRAVFQALAQDGQLPPGIYLVGAHSSAEPVSFAALMTTYQRLVDQVVPDEFARDARTSAPNVVAAAPDRT